MKATSMQVNSAHRMVARLWPRHAAALPCTRCMASATDRLQHAGHELKEGARQAAEKVRAGTYTSAQFCSSLAVRAAWLAFLAHAVTCSMLKIGAAVAVVDSQVAVASTYPPGLLQRCFLHSFAPMSTISR